MATKAFKRFDGLARAASTTAKPVVPDGWTPAHLQSGYLAFAAHYGMQPRAVRGEPNAKPHVERNFWEHERSFLNGRSFRDADDFAAQLADWLERIVDPRRRNKSSSSALDRFPEEAPHLLKLPTHPYDTARVAYRLCSIDGYVDWEGNRYAVPYDQVTDFLPIRVTQRELFVYAPDLRCVAKYELRPRGGGEKLDPLGLHGHARRRQSAIDQEQLRTAFAGMGDHAAAFFTSLGLAPRI